MYVPVQCDVRIGDIPPNRQYAAAMTTNICVDGPAFPPQRCFRVSGTSKITFAFEVSLGDDEDVEEEGHLTKRQIAQRKHWKSHVSGGYVVPPSTTSKVEHSDSWRLVFHAHPHTVNVTGAKVFIGSKRAIAVKKIRRIDAGGDDVPFDSVNTGVFEAVLSEPLPSGPTAAGQTISLVVSFTTAVRPAIKTGTPSNGHSGMCGLYYATAPSSGGGAWSSDLAGEALPRGCSSSSTAISASEYSIFSHFEVHHARRGFPCIDDPKVRLIWGLSLATSTPGVDGGGQVPTINPLLIQADPILSSAAIASTSSSKPSKGSKSLSSSAAGTPVVSAARVAQSIQAASEVVASTTSGGIRYGFFCTPPSSCTPAESMVPDEDPLVSSSLGSEAVQYTPPISNVEFYPTTQPIPAYTVGLALLLGRDGGSSSTAATTTLQRVLYSPLLNVTTPTLLRVIHFPSLLHSAATSSSSGEINHFMKVTMDKACEGLQLLERDTFKSPIPIGDFATFIDGDDEDGLCSLTPYVPPCVETTVSSAAGSGLEGRRLNIVYIPLMPIGGMEHHGNIFLNESIIRPPLKNAKVKVEDEVITLVVHELCHHWLGNVVGLPFEIKEGLCQVLERAIGNSIQGIGGAPKVTPSPSTNTPAPTSSSPGCGCGKGGGGGLGKGKSGGGGSTSSSAPPKEGEELTGLTYQHAFNHIQQAVGECGWGPFEIALQALIKEWRGNYILDDKKKDNGEVGGAGGDRVTFSAYLPH